MAETKQANSFDKATWLSILNSFLLNCIGAAGAFMVSLPQTNSWKGSLIIAASTFGAFLVNVPREWLKGEKVVDPKNNNQ